MWVRTAPCATMARSFWAGNGPEKRGGLLLTGSTPPFSMRWFLADVLGPFSINVGSFSRNAVPSVRIFSVIPVPKRPMFSVPASYVLGPLHLGLASLTSYRFNSTFSSEKKVHLKFLYSWRLDSFRK